MNSEKSITASFTGHRDYDSRYDESLRTQIRQLYEAGYRIFLCGMARGFDLAAGEAVVALQSECTQIKLRCIIPYRGHEQSLSERDRERYRRLTEMADEVVTLAEQYHAGAYHFRNDYLVNNASAIVAYYNGSKGGTHYTMRRALKRYLRIHNICTFREGELF